MLLSCSRVSSGVLLRQAIAAKLQRYRETGNTDHAFWDALVFRKVRQNGTRLSILC